VGGSADATRTFGIRKGRRATDRGPLGDRLSPLLSIVIPNAPGILPPVPRLAAAGAAATAGDRGDGPTQGDS